MTGIAALLPTAKRISQSISQSFVCLKLNKKNNKKTYACIKITEKIVALNVNRKQADRTELSTHRSVIISDLVDVVIVDVTACAIS